MNDTTSAAIPFARASFASVNANCRPSTSCLRVRALGSFVTAPASTTRRCVAPTRCAPFTAVAVSRDARRDLHAARTA